MKITFQQSYDIQQFTTIGQGCPVLVDKLNGAKLLSPPDPIDWIKGQIFNFAIIKSASKEVSFVDRSITLFHIV